MKQRMNRTVPMPKPEERPPVVIVEPTMLGAQVATPPPDGAIMRKLFGRDGYVTGGTIHIEEVNAPDGRRKDLNLRIEFMLGNQTRAYDFPVKSGGGKLDSTGVDVSQGERMVVTLKPFEPGVTVKGVWLVLNFMAGRRLSIEPALIGEAEADAGSLVSNPE